MTQESSPGTALATGLSRVGEEDIHACLACQTCHPSVGRRQPLIPTYITRKFTKGYKKSIRKDPRQVAFLFEAMDHPKSIDVIRMIGPLGPAIRPSFGRHRGRRWSPCARTSTRPGRSGG